MPIQKRTRTIVVPYPLINGRRGAFQLLFSSVFALMAAACIVAEDFPPAIAWLGQFLPGPWPLAIVWGIPALIGIVSAFFSRPYDAVGFAALSTPTLLYGAFYGVGMFISPHGTAPLGMLLYLALSGAVVVASGMQGAKDRDVRKVVV